MKVIYTPVLHQGGNESLGNCLAPSVKQKILLKAETETHSNLITPKYSSEPTLQNLHLLNLPLNSYNDESGPPLSFYHPVFIQYISWRDFQGIMRKLFFWGLSLTIGQKGGAALLSWTSITPTWKKAIWISWNHTHKLFCLFFCVCISSARDVTPFNTIYRETEPEFQQW